MRCPNCGTESNISTGFCACCGSPLPEKETADQSSEPIAPILPGENYFPVHPVAQTVQTAEKLVIDTSYEAAQTEQRHKKKAVVISVLIGFLALVAIIFGIVLAVHNSNPGGNPTPGAISHSYDAYYESLSEIEKTGHFFVSTEISTPNGALRQVRYATDGKSIYATGIFDNYNVIINTDSFYIISTDGQYGALVPDNMLSLCKGFTKESCKLGLSYFGFEKPSSEPTDTVNGDTGISCTFTATDEQKAQGIYTYISFYDSHGKLKSTEYRDKSGASVKTVRFNEITGVFDPSKFFTPASSINLYTTASEVRAFLGTIFEEEIQGDITVSGLGLSCSIPSGLFAVYSGVKQEDAIRCGFTETDTQAMLENLDENTYILFTDGTQEIGTLSVYTSSGKDYASVSSMTDINNALMDFYAASFSSVSFIGNCVYNNIRYAYMQGKTTDGSCSVIYDTIHAGLHFKFIFSFASESLACEAKEKINKIISSVSVNASAITVIPDSEYQEYTEQIDSYGISFTVPSGWFSVSAKTTKTEAAALRFSAINIDILKNMLEPDGGIFAVLASVQTSDNITCEFYAADEPDRNTLDTAQLNICKNDIQDFYKEKYGSSATVEETVKYNNAVYFVINAGNRLTYETVYGGYYYVYSYNTSVVSDTAKNILQSLVSTIHYNPSVITAVPSVSYAPSAAQAYSNEIGSSGLSCTVPAGWFAVSANSRQSDAVARGFEQFSVSDYTNKIKNSDKLISCIVCAQKEAVLEGAEIDISEYSYSSKDFAAMNQQELSEAAETFKGYYVGILDAVEYSGTVSFNGLKYIIISAYSSGKGVRIYETVYNGINYSVYMEGISGALSPMELSLLNSFISSITP